jgi:uncharacterized protein (TIGR00288 family)
MTGRVAVLVDGDNISAEYGDEILGISARYGRVESARIYFNAQNCSEWHKATGYRTVHAGIGKNASDLLLAIDAMEIALTHEFDAFVVATSDGDFSHLVQRLRERHLTTIGVGEAKAPDKFRSNCTTFVELGDRLPCAVSRRKPTTCAKLDRQIRSVIAIHSKNGAGMKMTALAPQMHQKFGVRISTYPEGNWRAYLLARPALFDLDPKGSDAMVRFKPEGFANSELLDIS